MATNTSTFKTFLNNDIVSTRSMLHEAIPLTGSIVSGNYGGNNIKNFSHGMFQSVYDYPYLSSSANHIFDVTVGYSSNSILSSSTAVQNSKKINIYNQMAQLLAGYDADGKIREFDADGDLSGGRKIREAFFINFSRLLTKDEIKKQSFSMTVMTGGTCFNPSGNVTLADLQANTSYKINSPAGEYAVLYTGSATGDTAKGVGLLYYQAGIAVVTASVFAGRNQQPPNLNDYFGPPNAPLHRKYSVSGSLTGSQISSSADGFRNRLKNISFNNTTELNSTVYFCRANNNEFNYSSNPTYLSSSKIQVKTNAVDNPVSYITTVGLYAADNELLAVAKLSEPLKKDPTNEFTLRVRLDY